MNPRNLLAVLIFESQISTLEARIEMHKMLMPDKSIPKECETLLKIMREGSEYFQNAPDDLTKQQIETFVNRKMKEVRESQKRFQLDNLMEDKTTQQ